MKISMNTNKFKLTQFNGFTLVELLVVISIIGLLASIALVSFTGSQKQARDAQRKSDLKQYATSLESFANQNNGLYPAESVTVAAATALCTDLGLTGCTPDPKDGTASFGYNYQSDGVATDGAATATSYVVWAEVENQTGYWTVCSSGKVGLSASEPVGGACPL